MASKKSKILALSMAAALSAGILAGCSSSGDSGSSSESSSSSGKTTITWWNGFTGSDGVLMETIVQEYNESQDEIHVELDRIPWANFFEKMPTAMATGSGPDFVLWGPGDMPSYLEAGHVLSMDDYWDFATKDSKDDYVENILDTCYFDGTCYGVPFQTTTQVLYWNKDLFTKAGLDPETPPTTWDEVRSFSEKLTDKSNGIYGWGFQVDGQLFYEVKEFGGTYIDSETHENLVTETKDSIIDCFTWYQNMINDGLSPANVTGADMDNLFTAGTVAMYRNGTWQIPGNQDKGLNFGVGLMPTGSAGRYVPLTINNFSVMNGVTDEEKEAVYTFIEWWQTEGSAKRWSLENSCSTYLKSVLEDPEVQANAVVKMTSDLMEEAVMDYAVPLNNVTVLNNDYINKAVNNVTSGDDVAAVVDQLAEDIDAYLAEYEAAA